MIATKAHILACIRGLWLALACTSAAASPYQDADTARAMADVVKIAHAISVVQPNLPEAKYIEYAMGIYRAAKKYDIRPALIIAIAHQESSFQEKLPEGKAGEIGITQVLKRWLKNPKFRAEFPGVNLSSMKKPANSFMHTAWILRELKEEENADTLPFWSFYNARKFKYRVKYFQRVNKHMAKLKRNLHRIERALDWDPDQSTLALMDKPAPRPVKKEVAETEPQPERVLAFQAEKPVPTRPWVENLPAKRKAIPKRDPRAALLKAATLVPGS